MAVVEVHVRGLREELYRRMKVLCAKTGKTMGEIANAALAEYLDKAEAAEQAGRAP